MVTEKQKHYRRLWIEALESGEYKQCRGMLVRADLEDQRSHCCLGVAAETAGIQPQRRLEYENQNAYTYTFSFIDYDGQSVAVQTNGATPRPWMAERFGLSQNAAGLLIDNLTGANDNWAPFAEIAKALREFFDTVDDDEVGAVAALDKFAANYMT